MKSTDNILIIGGGLCGSLLALRLAQRGHKVTVYEGRPDLRTTDISAGRSINLALSNRGFRALNLVGVADKAREICIPMMGRMMHDTKGNTFESSYSGNPKDYINSISRGDLNGILLSEAEKHSRVDIYFNTRCLDVDIDTNTAKFKSYDSGEEFDIQADVIFGTDGAGSALRKSYDKLFPTFQASQEFLTHGYKELEIPSAAGAHQISKDHLHIWPRGQYMLIALPNMDGSFTVTLFLSYQEGAYNFKNLTTEAQICAFFTEQFPDALALIPNILEEFENNPTGRLGTVKCYPWAYKNSLLLGDAAHAIVPFYGQGMNASFEDVVVLDSVMEAMEGSDWTSVFEAFQKERKKDADAIADLAIDNYYEMRDFVAHDDFIEKRKLEMVLEKKFPNDYASKYSLVTFNEHVGYHQAMTRGRAQDAFLLHKIRAGELSSADADNHNKLTEVLAELNKQIP